MGSASSVSPITVWSLRLAPATTTESGVPRASVSRLRLVPHLARSVGLGPVFSPTEGRLAHRPVQRQPRPVDPLQPIVGLRIPTEAGHSFRGEAGQRSDLMSATI